MSQKTPYLILSGKLWGVFCGDFRENRSRYNGTALHYSRFLSEMAILGHFLHFTLYNGCNYLSMLGLKSNHFSSGPVVIKWHFIPDRSITYWWLSTRLWNTSVLAVRQSEADNFGGGLGTFYWFTQFMFMTWDLWHEDLQLLWPEFQTLLALLRQFIKSCLWWYFISDHSTTYQWLNSIAFLRWSSDIHLYI